MTNQRLLGIDYGEKRVGLAVSDEAGQIAFPFRVVPNNVELIPFLKTLISDKQIAGVVIGESLNFKGKPNKIAPQVESFIKVLEQNFGISIDKQVEFLTTVEARRRGQGKEVSVARGAHSKIKKEISDAADAGAAALILQRYLDKRNKKGKN